MTREEWWLRLLMISGQKLQYIRRLKGLAYQKLVLTANLLLQLGFSDKQHQQFNAVDQAALKLGLDWLALPNHYLVTYIDADYPELLRNTPSAPLALFVSGEPGNLSKPQLAMVGSRCYSHYGETWASYFSQQLAAAGLVITSGLAMGIDGISHRGALASGGITVAILGSGLSRIHPRGHLRLAQQILDSGGSLVSEFLPFEAARAEYFPKRNRIISGLSLGVLVIEAEMRSGSLITAKYALEQGREVFAIPGPLGSRNSEGTHSLIQQGANLVAQPTDIIEILNSSLRWLVLEQLVRYIRSFYHYKSMKIAMRWNPNFNSHHCWTMWGINRPRPILLVKGLSFRRVMWLFSYWILSFWGDYIRSGRLCQNQIVSF
ncbi:DNA protecting protein DprA [Budvicia aquatica]|uniref:DNA protecting protein DprA n=1 Tax=Budvicia aquatica TaxID=82979 RepID=A0A484ZID1_9GAMM|nr:DNA protecting protein DprA [Budvicia aquatica]